MSELISTIEDAVLALRPRLLDYLSIKLGLDNPKKPFYCPFHDDTGKPNMVLNPKANFEVGTCFSCGAKGRDIFAFASRIDNLPANGPDWVKITIPELCKTLDIKFQLGEQTEASKMKSTHLKLLQDISNILSVNKDPDYEKSRSWRETKLITGSIDLEKLLYELEILGWDSNYVKSTSLVCWTKRNPDDSYKIQSLFGSDKYTWVIQDPYGRPIGFQMRWKNYDKEIHSEKYLHSLNSGVFNKSKVLLGLTDITSCKENGIYIFEGPGDVQAAQGSGLTNCACCMGSAVTEDSLLELKKLGIRKVTLCLDWDMAGQKGIERIIDEVIPKVTDMSFSIKTSPLEATQFSLKDPDEYFKKYKLDNFLAIKELSVFEYKLKQLAISLDTESLCKKLIPYIANETSAIKRNILTKQLVDYTGIQFASIEADVEAFRNLDTKEKRNSIVAAGQQLLVSLEQDPENAITLIGSFESDIEKIEKRYNRAALGVSFQLQKYQDLQSLRKLSTTDQDAATFKFRYFTEFSNNFNGGMPITRGCLIYCGGRANSGKTLSTLALGTDVALHDDKAMTIIQTMDDSYEQIEPRLKTNIFNMYYDKDIHLTLDMAVSPWRYQENEDIVRALKKADELFMDLLSEERLVILDSNDGPNLTTFERSLRYYRTRYPERKILGIQDNTHDLQDFPGLDQTTRMKQISAGQKTLSNKYNMCLLATTEYRKAPPQASTKMILPTNDDIADSRSMSYKPNIIMHVYNDLADRGEDNAEVFWIKNGKKMPRLMWVVTKNKISSFKGTLVNDIDPTAVMLYPKTEVEAYEDFERGYSIPAENKKEMDELDNELSYEVDTEFKGE